jgi:hypothetical protein
LSWLCCSLLLAFLAATAQVKEGYFKGLVKAGRIQQEELAEHIFASKPASGGAVLKLKL